MSKQDRQGVRTAADLERKYKFGSFGKGGKSAYEYAKDGGYTGTEEEFAVKLGTDSDYIVEQGKIDNTYYRKWNSGVLEQWLDVKTIEQVINTAYGTWYIGTYAWTFPIEFVDIPVCTSGIAHWGTSASFGCIQGVGQFAANIRLYDMYSRAAGTQTHIQAYAHGHWK